MNEIEFSNSVKKKADLVIKIADHLRGAYTPGKYGSIIIPMTVIRRFDAIIESNFDELQDAYDLFKKSQNDNIESNVFNYCGIPFFNKSKLTLNKILNDPDNLFINFKKYLKSFSDNVFEIIDKLGFINELETLEKHNLLFTIIKEFCNEKLNFQNSTDIEMGYIFEDIIRRFKENAEAGDHYTPREVIELCTDLLLSDYEDMDVNGKLFKVYDGCFGTGGMLSVSESKIVEKRKQKGIKNTTIRLYGQDINDEGYAICKANMLIKGQDVDNIRHRDTLTEDQFKKEKFNFLITNSPFGVNWKTSKKKVLDECNSMDSRFKKGLPKISDGQLLFLQNMISKLDKKGRLVIIMNGSPLFNGDAGSGESEIRKWIIENDWLESIVALPTDMFYNTSIATYIWVLTEKKSSLRQGKVQLIDGRKEFKLLQKSLGKKRKELHQNNIDKIKDVFKEFANCEQSKILSNKELGYNQITLEIINENEGKLVEDVYDTLKEKASFKKLSDDDKMVIIDSLRDLNITKYDTKQSFEKCIEKSIKINLSSQILNDIIKSCLSIDKENIPLAVNQNKYFDEEVMPHVKNYFVDEKKSKIGYEIPITKYFYEFKEPEKFDTLWSEIKDLEHQLSELLDEV